MPPEARPEPLPEPLPEPPSETGSTPPGEWRTTLPTAESTRALGARLGQVLRAGDLLVLTGDLGAGKTTLVQGLGEGLGVRGPVTSPTFVIARVHPSLVGGPPLVHVDAYRLGGTLELDDLDLDASVDDSVTVVEWGHGVAELLAEDRLEIVLRLSEEAVGDADTAGEGDGARVGDGSDVSRTASLLAVGPRWARAQAGHGLDAVVGAALEGPRVEPDQSVEIDV